jgi:NAD(P)-dependent dehydrogenase (short-subunit alcohol dehydrogenase family)
VLDGVDLTGRTILVTGGTTGLGYETAGSLARAGAAVVITARTHEKGAAAVRKLVDAAPGADITYAVLELASLASVRAFTDAFVSEHDRLDVLIANAGVMAAPEGRTEDGFELHFGTNFVGHFVLVGRLIPLLVASAPSRIVVLSSDGHRASDIVWDDVNFDDRAYVKMEAYGQSKTADVLHAVELDRRLAPFGVRALAVHPGMVGTDLGRNFTKDDIADLRQRAAAGGGLPALVGTDVGAATSVWAATATELADNGGTYFADCAVAEAADYATDPHAARRLWAMAEQMTGEQYPEPF